MRWLVVALCLVPMRLVAAPTFVQSSVGQHALDYRLVVFFPADAPSVAQRSALLQRLAGKAPPDVSVVSVSASVPPETLEEDAGIGARARATKATLAIQVRGPATTAWRALEVSTRLADSLAQAGGVAIFDEVTHQIYAPATWHRRRVEAIVAGRKEVVAHILAYAQTPRATVVTLGMVKLGLPELVITDSTPAREDGLNTAIAFVGQTLFAAGGKLSGDVLHVDLRDSPLLEPAPKNGRVDVRFVKQHELLEVWAGDPRLPAYDRQTALFGALR